MSDLGSDPALVESVTLTMSMSEDEFGLGQCQPLCRMVVGQHCRRMLCTALTTMKDAALGSCCDNRRAGTGPGCNPVQVPAAKASARQDDNGNCDTASIAVLPLC